MRPLNNLGQRLITALAGSAVVIAAVVYSPWTYFMVFALMTLLTLREFYILSGLDGMVPQKNFGIVIGVMIYCSSFFIEFEHISYKYYFLIFPLMSFVYLIKLYKKNEEKPFTNTAFTFLGLFYVAVPFSLLNIAAFENASYNYEIILGCLLMLWANDSGAYFAGMRFGKTKLFERISPKKSWEGVVGGAILALLFAWGLSQFFLTLPLWKWISVSIIIVVCGDYGDLVESHLKRSIHIKDSGNTLPGHGGFLDRFDGLLISAPFIVAFLEIFS